MQKMQKFLTAIAPLVKRFFPKYTGSITLHIRAGEIMEAERIEREKFKSAVCVPK